MLIREYKPSTPRAQRLRDAYFQTKPSICSERAVLYTESHKQTEGMHPTIRQALAFEKILAEMTIYIQEDELLVGNVASRPHGTSIYPEYAYEYIKLDTISTRESDPYLVNGEDKRRLEECFKYWSGKTLSSAVESWTPSEIKKAENIGVFTSQHLKAASPGHVIPGNEMVVQKGLGGIIKEAEDHLNSLDLSNPDDIPMWFFLQAAIIVDKAVIKWCKRYADLAREKATKEKNSRRKAELEKIAMVCDWLPANPARNFWEVLQAVLFVTKAEFIEANGPSLTIGRLDQFTYPYYEKDIKIGVLTKSEAMELLECFFLKLSDHCKVGGEVWQKFWRGYPTFMQITIGGLTRDGEEAVNDLSYMVLDVCGNMRLTKPLLSARIHNNTPDEFLMKCCEVIYAHRGGMPALLSDDVTIPSLALHNPGRYEESTYDFTSDIYDWAVIGCVEPGFPGKGFSTASFISWINLGKLLEVTLYGGKCPKTGVQLAFTSSDMTTWKSYDDMIQALLKHAKYYFKLAVTELNIIYQIHKINLPTPFLSSLMRDCIKRGHSIFDGGGIYEGASFNFIGVANFGNSLKAIRKLVFEDQAITMQQLKHALETNFTDTTTNPTGPEIQQMCLAVPKYGNDDESTDKILRDVMDMLTREARKFKSPAGRNFSVMIVPITAHMAFGALVGATPDGRNAWQPLAEGCSPTQGTDKIGPTGVIKSVARIGHINYDGGTLFNMKFNPTLVQDEAGRRKFAALIRTYFNLGGFHVQFNFVSAETLRDAQEHPEKYKDLMVRVAGYSAYFVTLDKAAQDDIIARTEHMRY